MNFDNNTDFNLAKLFFRELADAKTQGFKSMDVKYFYFLLSKDSKMLSDENIPKEIVKMVDNNPKAYNAGFVSFNFYRDSFKKLEGKLDFVVNFRFYTLFHIQSLKSCMHIKMNKRYKDMEAKLGHCKIISEDVLKGVETSSFFDQQSKKFDDIKNFKEDNINKVNS